MKIAQRMFLRHGYDATSMAKLAKEAGVAANTIYWYFADKDALLVEVLNTTMLSMTGQYLEHINEPPDAQLLWLVEVLEESRMLVSTVHARCTVAPVVAQWHERFHAFLEATFVDRMRQRGVPLEHARHAAKITSFVLEGLLSHDIAPLERRAVIATLVASLP